MSWTADINNRRHAIFATFGKILLLIFFFILGPRCSWAAGQIGHVSFETEGGFYLNLFWVFLSVIALVGWLFATWWVSDDAQGNSLNYKLWPSILLGAGWLNFLCMVFVHPAFAFVLIVTVAVVLLVYVIQRNKHVPVQYQLLQRWLGSEEAKLQIEGDEERETQHNVELKNRSGRKMGDLVAVNPKLSPCIEVLGNILATSCIQQVSRVTIMPAGEDYIVECEVDGVKHKSDRLEANVARIVFKTLKSFLGLKVGKGKSGKLRVVLPSDETVPIDVRFQKNKKGTGMEFDFPDWTEDIHRSGLVAMGMNEEMAERVKEVLQKPQSSTLIAGEKGSGRTATLYALMSEIDIFTTDVTLIEPHPQHELKHVARREEKIESEQQAQTIIEELKRAEIDCVGVDQIGEIEILNPFFSYVVDGHSFLATLPASGVVAMLKKLVKHCDRQQVARVGSCIVGQKLVRTLCENCKEEFEPNPKLLSRLNLTPSNCGQWFRPVGCEECLGTGYKGRTALYEVLFLEGKVPGFIAKNKITKKGLRKAAAGSDSYQTFYKAALSKVKDGQTTLKEIKRVLNAGQGG